MRPSQAAVARFGGIDILVNNASAISLTGTLEQTPMKRFDLMHQVNCAARFSARRRRCRTCGAPPTRTS